RRRIVKDVARRRHRAEPFAQIALAKAGPRGQLRAGHTARVCERAEDAQPIAYVAECAEHRSADVGRNLLREILNLAPVELPLFVCHQITSARAVSIIASRPARFPRANYSSEVVAIGSGLASGSPNIDSWTGSRSFSAGGVKSPARSANGRNFSYNS